MMLAEYSIWLLPESVRESELSGLVARLSNDLGGIAFAPHVTNTSGLRPMTSATSSGKRSV